MAKEETMAPGDSTKIDAAQSIVIRVEARESALKSGMRRLLLMVFIVSVLINVLFMLMSLTDAEPAKSRVQHSHHSGTKNAASRLAVINFSGTIMPPFTSRWLQQIEAAAADDSVKGVLLAIDSPGGLVADSHQIYHELLKLRKKKPIYVAMKRLAASGGYYISMGIGQQGRIYVEPTTWTGSIGVIIPRYNAAGLAEKVGVTVEPLATGPMKDSLNPFRNLSERERGIWDAILADSFDRFVTVISDNRSGLSDADVRELATGQIYTANQAVENGLADEIGYEEDALAALAASIDLSDYEAIEYSSPSTLLDVLLSKAESPPSISEQVLNASIPKAMYYCSWNPWVPTTEQSF